jgi:hypothetical protein
MIVCLGWGSLIWDPKKLPLAGDWHDDGPELPVEFLRQSKNGRLTLVIDPESPKQRVLWAPLSVKLSSEAVSALSTREETETDRPIGRWPEPRSSYACADVIEHWAHSCGFDGVVWTALGPKFPNERGRPTEAEALEYLGNLVGEARRLAEEYVRKAPTQIGTPYRRAIEEALGWSPLEGEVAKS